MHPRSLWATGDVCLRCEWRLLNKRQCLRRKSGRSGVSSHTVSPIQRQALHAASNSPSVSNSTTTSSQSFDPLAIPRPPQLPIRQHLEQWQQQFGGPSKETLSAFENHPARDDIQNNLSKLSSGFNAVNDTITNEWEGGEGDEGEELITIGLFLKPGDVVELLQADREPVYAVFVQQLENNISQFFTVTGRWCHSVLTRVSFAITGCIDPALLRPLLPFLPTDPGTADPKGEVHVPTQLAAPVKKKLEQMTEEAERIYRTNAPVLDSAYTVLADPARTRMMTLTQIAKTLLARNDPTWTPSPAALLAVRKALHHNEFRFRSDMRSHRLTNVFAIRSKSDVQMVETVHDWIREYREYLAVSANAPREISRKRSKGAGYIAEFLEKSRRLIATSRTDRDPNLGNLGPSKTHLKAPDESSLVQVLWGETFTSTDKQIINFLQAWVLSNQFFGMSGLSSACATLLLATDCYGSNDIKHVGMHNPTATEFKRSMGILFLQEIGVISPYENRAIYDEQLMLPTIRVSRNLELLNTKAELTRKNPDFRDTMADLRRDWGSTTVYCIDDANAHEIDDGISIERIEGQDSEFWIHVHVANPTAFFDKTHTLSGLAAHMTETVYTPERSFPMLPAWATQGYFSLSRNRPVITFSSRINRNGMILETKIQHGIIRKIVSLTPSEVASLLGDHSTVVSQRLVVGGDLPRHENDRALPNLTQEQLQDLQDLYTAAQGLWEARKSAGGVRFGTPAPNVRVFENLRQAGITWNPPSIDRARWIRGDPIIEITSIVPQNFVQLNIGPRNIVEEMMMLACETAASWCAERQIPVMYRGTIEPPNHDISSSAQMREQIMSYWDKQKEPPLKLAVSYMNSLGRAIAHSAPLPHKIIGVSSYVKVTSPLRRFSDMIAHWQIEAAIRYEARFGKKFNAAEAITASRGILPFSQRQMQESIITLSPRERIISMTKQASTRYWTTLAFLRAFHYEQASLPEVFRFWVRSGPNAISGDWRGLLGNLVDYGLQAKLLEEDSAELGDEWEVRLDSVDVFSGEIYVRPVRLLSRNADIL